MNQSTFAKIRAELEDAMRQLWWITSGGALEPTSFAITAEEKLSNVLTLLDAIQYKKCETCGGTGRVYEKCEAPGCGSVHSARCQNCKGSGHKILSLPLQVKS